MGDECGNWPADLWRSLQHRQYRKGSARRGFKYGSEPGALNVGWNGGHTAATLPDGTPVSSGEGGGVRIGGGGAFQKQFGHHMFLPMPVDEGVAPDAPEAPVVMMAGEVPMAPAPAPDPFMAPPPAPEPLMDPPPPLRIRSRRRPRPRIRSRRRHRRISLRLPDPVPSSSRSCPRLASRA